MINEDLNCKPRTLTCLSPTPPYLLTKMYVHTHINAHHKKYRYLKKNHPYDWIEDWICHMWELLIKVFCVWHLSLIYIYAGKTDTESSPIMHGNSFLVVSHDCLTTGLWKCLLSKWLWVKDSNASLSFNLQFFRNASSLRWDIVYYWSCKSPGQ